jgi:hypothetical protein
MSNLPGAEDSHGRPIQAADQASKDGRSVPIEHDPGRQLWARHINGDRRALFQTRQIICNRQPCGANTGSAPEWPLLHVGKIRYYNHGPSSTSSEVKLDPEDVEQLNKWIGI